MKRVMVYSVVLSLVCAAAYGQADNFTWTNTSTGGGQYWDNPANWGDGSIGIPNTPNDNITINNGGKMSLPQSGTYVCGEINVLAGGMGGWYSNATIIVTDNDGLSGGVYFDPGTYSTSYQGSMTWKVYGDWVLSTGTWEKNIGLLELYGDNNVVRKTGTDGPVQNTDIYGSYYEQGSSGDVRTQRFGNLTVKDGGSITGGLWAVKSLKVEGSGALVAGDFLFGCRGDQDNTTEDGGKLVLPGGVLMPNDVYMGQLYSGGVNDSVFVYKMDGGGDLMAKGSVGVNGARAYTPWHTSTVILDLQDNGTGTPRGIDIDGNLQVGPGPLHSTANSRWQGLLKAYEGEIRVGGDVVCGGSNSIARSSATYTFPGGSMQLGDVRMRVGGDWIMNRSPSRLTSEFIYANWDPGTSTIIFDGNGTAATQLLACDELPLHNVIVDNPGGLVQMYSYQADRDNMIITGNLEIRSGTFQMRSISAADPRNRTLRITFAGTDDQNWSDNASTAFEDIELAADAVVLLSSDISMGNLFMGSDSRMYLQGFTLVTSAATYDGSLGGSWNVGGGTIFAGLKQVPGDANGDGKVDGTDLAIWQQNYDPLGGGNATFATGDWNGDGKVDGTDLALWQQNYDPLGTGGLDGLGTGVPEPATLLLLGTGLIGAVGVIRRRRTK